MSHSIIILFSISIVFVAISLTQGFKISKYNVFKGIFQSRLLSVTDKLIQDVSIKQAENFVTVKSSDRKDLTIFVIDTSLPGSNRRINAVRGTIAETLPKERVSVITCFGDSAEVLVKPTGSLIDATRHFSKIHRSVQGNLGYGLNKALDIVDEEFEQGASSITIAIIADGYAHGLTRGSIDCEHDFADVCDLELLESAQRVTDAKSLANRNQLKLKVVIVDTNSQELVNSSQQGSKLAVVTEANYFHTPDLSDSSLSSILSTIKTE